MFQKPRMLHSLSRLIAISTLSQSVCLLSIALQYCVERASCI